MVKLRSVNKSLIQLNIIGLRVTVHISNGKVPEDKEVGELFSPQYISNRMNMLYLHSLKGL